MWGFPDWDVAADGNRQGFLSVDRVGRKQERAGTTRSQLAAKR